VPRLVPADLRSPLTGQFSARFHEKLRQAGIDVESPRAAAPDELSGVKAHTQQNFGFEWTAYARHGWDDPQYNIATEESVFRHKSLMDPSELAGRLVLDGGCGNGRYTYWASRYGGRVIGVDLTEAVDAAYTNTREVESIGIVQGDLFRLPFPRAHFDVAFSIGVLMHTGDARGAFLSIARHVRPGGRLTAHVYGVGNAIYEWVDRALRARTTRLTIPQLSRLTDRLYRVARWSDRLGLRAVATCFIRLDDHPHCIFDWYAAPVASHHTYDEVEAWYAEAGLRVERTHRTFTSSVPVKRFFMRLLRYPWPVTVRGVRLAQG
jgi:SAM-dependent methyltransferase